MGAEKEKIEEWKRAIENFKGDRIIYEKDLEILRKDQQHLQQERGAFAADIKNVSTDKEKLVSILLVIAPRLRVLRDVKIT